MPIFERLSPFRRPRGLSVRGFSLTELLVVVAIVLMLTSLAGAAISAASSSQKKFRTKTLISKLDSIVGAQYAEYGSRTIGGAAGSDRGALLRAMAQGDLPDSWAIVTDLAKKTAADLTPHQRAYVAVWPSSASDQQRVMAANAGAECLFMIVMQGGIADCLDCRGLQAEIGDQDGDGMPEFLDAWGTPVGFVLWPSGLRLPADSGTPFFASTLPFEPIVPSVTDAKGGLMRPLVFSAGPDREYGIDAQASPLPGASAHTDNLTNFDEEAKR
jgi:prepilin-type N-terminal cleavage/methylation domain-containing protein